LPGVFRKGSDRGASPPEIGNAGKKARHYGEGLAATISIEERVGE
jgi:hypothetical protein